MSSPWSSSSSSCSPNRSVLRAAFAASSPPPPPDVAIVERRDVAVDALEGCRSGGEPFETSWSAMRRGTTEWSRAAAVPPAWAADDASTAAAAVPPTEAEVAALRRAFDALYGTGANAGAPKPAEADVLLTESLGAWERANRPPDERAAVLRVRGDCRAELGRFREAADDYVETIRLLSSSPDAADAADPSELPAARLGLARARRATGDPLAVDDYAAALGDDLDDAASSNPYAAWEYGAALRERGRYARAAEARTAARRGFAAVGDGARAARAELDAALDEAMAEHVVDVGATIARLDRAAADTVDVASRDVRALQRLVAKEGEARVAAASLSWDRGDRIGAESRLGEACVRLEQLDVDDRARRARDGDENNDRRRGRRPSSDDPMLVTRVPSGYGIDDGVGAGEISCARFKNKTFLTETLGWSESLQTKLRKLQTLGS